MWQTDFGYGDYLVLQGVVDNNKLYWVKNISLNFVLLKSILV